MILVLRDFLQSRGCPAPVVKLVGRPSRQRPVYQQDGGVLQGSYEQQHSENRRKEINDKPTVTTEMPGLREGSR